MNPCPCGYLGHRIRACRCTPDQVLRYQDRISGPLLDRIDVRVEMASFSDEDFAAMPDGEPSARVAARVHTARERALQRQGKPNARLGPAELKPSGSTDGAAQSLLNSAATRLGWSLRAVHRVVRVARTVADLEGSAAIAGPHIAEAIQFRRALRDA
jgi:magnesium chelatase family protein